MIAVLNDLYEENAALKARIKQLEALLKEAMHRPNPDIGRATISANAENRRKTPAA